MRRSRGRSDDGGADRESEARVPLMLRHPRRSLAVAALVIAVLFAFGTGLDDRLSPSTIEISGTSASRANGMLENTSADGALPDPAARPGRRDRPPGPGPDP